jgi:farnesyl diphosphate synthase
MNKPIPLGINEQTTAFSHWAHNMQLRMENVLDTHLPPANTSPARLHEAMRYSTMGGGKRVRALLAYAAGEFCGASIDKIDVPAAAVEIIHAFSLVHDDLPCMDDDDLRRGKPTAHKQYGEAMALLVGDALQSLAFQLVSQNKKLRSAAQKLKMLHILALASGSRGMAAKPLILKVLAFR